MNALCSQGQHQGAGPFCTRCGERILASDVGAPLAATKTSRKKPLLIGCGGIIAFFVVAGILGALFGESDPVLQPTVGAPSQVDEQSTAVPNRNSAKTYCY